MPDHIPEVHIEGGRVITAPDVALVWLPVDGEVIAKIPARKGNRRWLHESVEIRSPHLEDHRWYLPRSCLNRLVNAAVDRYGYVVVVRDMAKLSRCTRVCQNATGVDCDCSCMGISHGSAVTDSWVATVGDAVFSNLGEFTRTAVPFGPQGSDLDAVLYNGELAGYPYRADRVRRHKEGWPPAYRFMCAACVSVQAEVWDHCHAHGYVRAPLCGPCNTRHWSGWRPERGRAAVSRNLDSTYYRWCVEYDAEENWCTA